jgi:hypothetical protein
MRREEDRRLEEDVRRIPDATDDQDTSRKDARNEADDWADVGAEDPAFYLKPSDEG